MRPQGISTYSLLDYIVRYDNPAAVTRLVALVEKYSMADRVVIVSRSDDIVAKFKAD